MLKWLSNVCFYLNYLVFADDGVAPNQNGGSVESEQSDGSAESEQGKIFILNSQLSNVRVSRANHTVCIIVFFYLKVDQQSDVQVVASGSQLQPSTNSSQELQPPANSSQELQSPTNRSSSPPPTAARSSSHLPTAARSSSPPPTVARSSSRLPTAAMEDGRLWFVVINAEKTTAGNTCHHQNGSYLQNR